MIEVNGLTKVYTSGIIAKQKNRAVDSVSFCVQRGETLGIIGESGCGKSTIARMAAHLIKNTDGKILLDGRDITHLKKSERKLFHRKVQIMFQNPESSLDPCMKIYDSIAEVFRIHKLTCTKKETEKRIHELVELVGLQKEHLNRYPRELSGGQIQRAVLARILALEPSVLIADEPTSMLDVSVQAQILTLLKQFQKELNFACVFISHDLDVVRIMCDRVAVMYNGKIIEQGTVHEIFDTPCQQYTKVLLGKFYGGY